MKAFAICLGLTLTFLWGAGMASAGESDGLVAIDVLLLPDQTMATTARAVNARLREQYPGGFALDATHVPHLTLLQCYVRATDLPAITMAVEAVLRRTPPVGMEFAATGYFSGHIADVGVTGISVRNIPVLTRLHRDVVNAVAPFIRHGGTAAAFVDVPASKTIGWTVDYVDGFVAKNSGPNFGPHVTAGISSPNFIARLAGEPFTAFNFRVEGAAIYQLGDIGTARTPLWVWQPVPSKAKK